MPLRGWRFRLPHLAQHVLQHLGGQMRVEAYERLAEPADQQYIVVAAALRCWTLRADVRSVQHGIAQSGELFESGIFYLAFSKSSHQAATLLVPRTNLAHSRRSIS